MSAQAQPDLESIVSAATAKAGADAGLTQDNKKDEQQQQQTQTDDKKDEVVDDKKDDKKVDVDDLGLTPSQVAEARQLMAALLDPNKAGTVVDFLAKQNGYEKPETKKEATQQAKGMVEELKEALGPELAYLAEKMGPIIEKQLKEGIEKGVGEVSKRVENQELAKLQDQAQAAQTSLGKKYFDDGIIPEDLIKEMSAQMNNLAAQKNQSMEDYLEGVLFLAAGRKQIQLAVKGTKQQDNTKKLDRNRNDAGQRLASDGQKTPKVGENLVHPNTQMTLEESVQKALEQSKQELTK